MAAAQASPKEMAKITKPFRDAVEQFEDGNDAAAFLERFSKGF